MLARGWESLRHTHFLPMSYWLDAPIAWLGRYEALPAEFGRLCDWLEIEHRALPHEHRGNGLQETIDEEMVSIIRECFAEDFARYGDLWP